MSDYKCLVRSKGRHLHVRDGSSKEDPVYVLTPAVGWVPFKNLPNGCGIGGDGDLDVKEIAVGDSVPQPPDPFVKPEHPALTAAKAKAEEKALRAMVEAEQQSTSGAKGTMAGRQRKANRDKGESKEE